MVVHKTWTRVTRFGGTKICAINPHLRLQRFNDLCFRYRPGPPCWVTRAATLRIGSPILYLFRKRCIVVEHICCWQLTQGKLVTDRIKFFSARTPRLANSHSRRNNGCHRSTVGSRSKLTSLMCASQYWEATCTAFHTLFFQVNGC